MRKLLLNLTLVSFFSCFGLHAVKILNSEVANPNYANPNKKQTKFLFVGNPGVGKTSLVNSLLKETAGKAGFSPGTGLSTKLNSYSKGKNIYMDTPGLSDTQKRKDAGKEIENALKQGGNYRIFFVVKLDSGRVRLDDVATINTVMAAIDIPDKRYNIIVNQMTKDDKIDFSNNPLAAGAVLAELNSGTCKTDRVWFVDWDKGYRRGQKDFISLGADFYSFVNNSSHKISFSEDNISELDTKNFEELKIEYQEKVETMQSDMLKSEEKQRELCQNLKKMQDDMANAAQEYESKLRDSEKKAQEKMNEINERFEAEKKALEDRLKNEQNEAVLQAQERLESFKAEMEGRSKDEQEKLRKTFEEKEALRKKENEEKEQKFQKELKEMNDKNARLFKEQQEKATKAHDELLRLLEEEKNKPKTIHHTTTTTHHHHHSPCIIS